MGKRFTVAKIDGSTSRTQRKQIIAAFESTPNPQIIVAHPKTAAHGLNLIAADTMIWFSPIHSLDVYGQACERMARPGQKLVTRIVHMAATKVERGVYAALRDKDNLQQRLLKLFKEEIEV
jgi:SNF2 family DNA or RNA helicase